MYLFDGCRGVSVFLADLITIQVRAPLSDGVGMMLVLVSHRYISGRLVSRLEMLSGLPTSLLVVLPAPLPVRGS